MPYPYMRSASSKVEYNTQFGFSDGESFRDNPERYTARILNKVSQSLANDLSVEEKKFSVFSDLKDLVSKSADPAEEDIDLLNVLTGNDDQPEKETGKDYENQFPSPLLNKLLKDGRLTRLNGEAFMKPENEVTTEVRRDFLKALKNGDVLLFPAPEKNAPGPSRLMISDEYSKLHCSAPMSPEELASEYQKLRKDSNVSRKEKAALEGAEGKIQKRLLLDKLKADPTFTDPSIEVYAVDPRHFYENPKKGVEQLVKYDYVLNKVDTQKLQQGSDLHSLLTSTGPDDPYNLSYDVNGKASLLIRKGDEMTVLTVKKDEKNKTAVFTEATTIEDANDFYEAVVGDGKNRYEEPSGLDMLFDSIVRFLRNIFNISSTAKERKEEQKEDAIAETERVFSNVQKLLDKDKSNEKTEEKAAEKEVEVKTKSPAMAPLRDETPANMRNTQPTGQVSWSMSLMNRAREMEKLKERLTPESLGADAEDPKYAAFVEKVSTLAEGSKTIRDMAFNMSDPNKNAMKPLYDSFDPDPKKDNLKEFFEKATAKKEQTFTKTEQPKTVTADKEFSK